MSQNEIYLAEKIKEIHENNEKIYEIGRNFDLKCEENDDNVAKLENMKVESEAKIGVCKNIEQELRDNVFQYEQREEELKLNQDNSILKHNMKLRLVNIMPN